MSDIWVPSGVTISTTDTLSGTGVVGRSIIYNPTLVWDPVTGTWVSDMSLLAAGGGRYHQQIVTIGRNSSGYGEVYYG